MSFPACNAQLSKIERWGTPITYCPKCKGIEMYSFLVSGGHYELPDV